MMAGRLGAASIGLNPRACAIPAFNAGLSEASRPPFRFRPKLLECLHGHTRERFVADLLAGVIVGVVALLFGAADKLDSVLRRAGLIRRRP